MAGDTIACESQQIKHLAPDTEIHTHTHTHTHTVTFCGCHPRHNGPAVLTTQLRKSLTSAPEGQLITTATAHVHDNEPYYQSYHTIRAIWKSHKQANLLLFTLKVTHTSTHSHKVGKQAPWVQKTQHFSKRGKIWQSLHVWERLWFEKERAEGDMFSSV